jgi:homopolymeric O-antigen transport system ATP-binding protein
MSDVAIRCERLAKRYEIGEREAYKTIRDVITDAVAAPFRGLRSAAQHSPRGNGSGDKPTIWALKDVSFEIKRGEVVGIIGRNGAGKSTLLKILSRITEPTQGQVEIWGRVGSLLEVGTGFHPELTGRDNIFLNGAILGMKKAEIARKFDEIVAFAEVEKFIDTPVKRYSSGMYVRLAFAVAAHMDTEILLVDEVLAVGDTQFQKKCLGKIGDVAKHGRTVLFITHNLLVVQQLCRTGMVLDGGSVVMRGAVGECVRKYSTLTEVGFTSGTVLAMDDSVGIKALRLLDQDGQLTDAWTYGRTLTVGVEVDVRRSCSRLAVDLTFYTMDGQRLFAVQSDSWPAASVREPGVYSVWFRIENPGFTVPEMYIDAGIRTATVGYDVLLPCAAYLLQSGNVPSHTHHLNLVTPPVTVTWT